MASSSAAQSASAHVHSNGYTRLMEFRPEPMASGSLAWVSAKREEIRSVLASTGAVLLRGIPPEVAAFQEVCGLIADELLPYTERSTPRSRVDGNVYTSTEYPADQSIPMHNENSYQLRWPTRLMFACHVAPESGGATPLADSASVLRLIPEQTRARFASGVCYRRNLSAGVGLSWQETFQTEDQAEVEAYCTRNEIDYAWHDGDLRISHVRPAVRRDPDSGREVWFNQAHLFHVSSLAPDVREALLAIYEPMELPRHACLADGSPILDTDLTTIRTAYDTAALAVPWSVGDVMIINNLRMAHGRQPFNGARRVLVAMA